MKKEESKSNLFKIGFLGGLGGLTLCLAFSVLPYSDYIFAVVIGIVFYSVVNLPYNDGIEISAITSTLKATKQISYLIISILISILATHALIKVIPKYGILSIRFLKGINFAGFILGAISYIIFNLKGRFDFPKFEKVFYPKAWLEKSDLKKFSYKVITEFSQKCIYCSTKFETIVDMKFMPSSNIWEQMFTKRIEPLKIPYCLKHASESIIFKRITFFVYLITYIYIIASNIRENMRFFDLAFLVVGAHIIAVLTQVGAKVLLTPFFPSISMMPTYNIIAFRGVIGRSLNIKVKVKTSDKTIELQLVRPIKLSELEKYNNENYIIHEEATVEENTDDKIKKTQLNSSKVG